jgi:predicted ATPase
MRDISVKTVTEQFRRIAKGGARLTKYSFKYLTAVNQDLDINPMELSFDVKPESLPPTNIHVLIGRNGVGKTHLIRNMIKSIVNSESSDHYGCFISDEDSSEIFSNVILVSFSAFDSLLNIEKTKIPYIRIGLPIKNDEEDLSNFFVKSLSSCLTGTKKYLLIKIIEILKSDPIFNESGIVELCSESKIDTKEEKINFDNKSKKLFERLSSGHKIIILTVTKLVQKVEEKTLVFLDEPEEHLHPPLLASFVRALSELLINRNGVAIIATHSPVILQEVPKKCVWKLRRNGVVAKAERLKNESFGGSIESLTSEVFGLEVTHSGYHKFLERAVEKYGDYDTIIRKFNGQLGMEAKDILKTLIVLKNEEENKQ